MRHEQRAWAAFNLALLKAIDPRLVTHRPRDPEKRHLMSELGIEMAIPDVEQEKPAGTCVIDIEITDIETDE
jgi:hypothetical protein